MEFNPNKCEVVHFGKSNWGRTYDRILRNVGELWGFRFPDSSNTVRSDGEDCIWHACLHRLRHRIYKMGCYVVTSQSTV